MISDVFVCGRLGEAINDRARYIEVERLMPSPEGELTVDRFPCMSCFGKEGALMTYPTGSLIVFKARIQMDPKLGLVLVEELSEAFRTSLEKITPDIRAKKPAKKADNPPKPVRLMDF